MFPYLGALVKGLNEKYRNFSYDRGLEAALAKAGLVCVSSRQTGRFSRGRLARACSGARVNKGRFNLRNVVDKSCKARQGRRGYATMEPFAVRSIIAALR